MAIGNPATIGSATLTSSATNTVQMTLTASVAVGDLIVVWVTNDGGANLPSGVTDSQGHTYTADVTGVRSADDYSLRQFSTVCTSAMTSAVDTITGTVVGGGGNWDKIIAAVKVTPDTGRTWGSSRVNTSAQATGTSTSPSSGSMTTTVADTAVIGGMAAGGAPSNSAGGPLTAATNSNTRVHNINGGAFIDLGSVYRVVTATGSYPSSGTWQASDDWGAVGVAYQQEALGGTVRMLATLGVGV